MLYPLHFAQPPFHCTRVGPRRRAPGHTSVGARARSASGKTPLPNRRRRRRRRPHHVQHTTERNKNARTHRSLVDIVSAIHIRTRLLAPARVRVCVRACECVCTFIDGTRLVRPGAPRFSSMNATCAHGCWPDNCAPARATQQRGARVARARVFLIRVWGSRRAACCTYPDHVPFVAFAARTLRLADRAVLSRTHKMSI